MVMVTLTQLIVPSVGRFFVTFSTAEVMILGLGYLIVLDKTEKKQVSNYAHFTLCMAKEKLVNKK